MILSGKVFSFFKNVDQKLNRYFFYTFTNRLQLWIEEEISGPQNLASAAVKFPSFTVVSRNYVVADIGIIGDYSSQLE